MICDEIFDFGVVPPWRNGRSFWPNSLVKWLKNGVFWLRSSLDTSKCRKILQIPTEPNNIVKIKACKKWLDCSKNERDVGNLNSPPFPYPQYKEAHRYIFFTVYQFLNRTPYSGVRQLTPTISVNLWKYSIINVKLGHF